MARIHIILAGHLAMSPRGRREAAVLQSAGHDVTLSGIWFDSTLAAIDRGLMRRERLRFVPAVDLRRDTISLARFVERARHRAARDLFCLAGWFNPDLLGYGIRKQLQQARRREADLTIVHSEAGLWIAHELLRDGRNVGVDFEDWFSRDLPPGERRSRPVAELARMEATVLQQASYRVASSSCLAQALAITFGVEKPAVVTNAGPESAQPHHTDRDAADGPLRLHWFSQTIGPSRGLDLLFAALPFVQHPVQVTLRGACRPAHRVWLDQTLPTALRASIIIAPPVPPWRLADCVAEHHVGLALETSDIPSRDVCISNKLFQYLASGLAVIATPTQGQREAMERCPAAGQLLDDPSPRALAEAIDVYATEPDLLQRAREAARSAAAGCWSGHAERETILELAEKAMGKEHDGEAQRGPITPLDASLVAHGTS